MSDRKTKTVPSDPEHQITEELTEQVELNGETRNMIDEETLREAGAMNAEAVQSNRRRQGVLSKKRGGQANIPWGEHRATLLYDDVSAYYGPATLRISVERQGGSPLTWELEGIIKDGRELYQAIMRQCHRRSPETKYRVVIRDGQSRAERGIGTVTLPSTEDDPPQPQQQPGYGFGATPPNGYGPPNPYGQQQQPPPYGAPYGYGQPQPQPQQAQAPAQQQAAAAPQAMPVPQMSAGASPEVLIGLGHQIGQMAAAVGHMQSQLQMLQQPQPAAAAPQPPAPPVYPRFRGGPVDSRYGVVPPGPGAYPQQQQPAQSARPTPPAEGMMYVENFGWVPTVKLLEALGHIPSQHPPQYAPAQQPQQAPVSPAKSAAEQFKDSIGLITIAVDAAQSMKSILPTTEAAAPVAAVKPEKEPPVKTIKLGDTNVVVNSDDGSTRLIETGLANLDKVMGWADKLHQRTIQFQREQQQGHQQPGQQPQTPQQAQPQGGMMPMPQWPGQK